MFQNPTIRQTSLSVTSIWIFKFRSSAHSSWLLACGLHVVPSPSLTFSPYPCPTKHKQHTKRDYLDHGLEADSPEALFRALDKELNKFKHYRKKGEKVRNAIKPVLELVNMCSEMIGQSLATASITSAQIYKTCLTSVGPGISTVKSNFYRYSGPAKETFEELKHFTGRLDILNQVEISKPLKKFIIEILAQLLVVLGVATKWINQNSATKYFKALIGQNTELSDAMGKLRMLSNQEVPTVTAVISATTTRTSRNVQAIRGDALRDQIRLWLNPPDPTANYNAAIYARPGL
ncbi:hypothetical protein HETIRDRAFT_102315 [Heterobasidion irregulare TC 32-1]|uniref:Fungal STAND N-terminal Goodbye domain-containing protein n=1 Tax=Heterobasidion irregulare (strain TC 32-1) TaxID=747525 RepID=W4KCV8_HETIT|nr:uncharacterized protein HETIRDRAFT_102315 [Heterobasidion irregulare TC 32-1]ETW83618.1 hypothetical protein HETIRDRAFT_102315 [Heterobasidion irregulare TC 32-1]